MHVFSNPTRTSIWIILHFPGIYICVFYQIPWFCLKTEHKLAYRCHFKYFQWEIWEDNWFSVIISCLLYRLLVGLLFYGFKVTQAEHSHVPTIDKAVTNDLWC
jgi:hypothetical protein